MNNLMISGKQIAGEHALLNPPYFTIFQEICYVKKRSCSRPVCFTTKSETFRRSVEPLRNDKTRYTKKWKKKENLEKKEGEISNLANRIGQ